MFSDRKIQRKTVECNIHTNYYKFTLTSFILNVTSTGYSREVKKIVVSHVNKIHLSKLSIFWKYFLSKRVLKLNNEQNSLWKAKVLNLIVSDGAVYHKHGWTKHYLDKKWRNYFWQKKNSEVSGVILGGTTKLRSGRII